MTTEQIKQYYSNLLILQYLSKPKAVATIQLSVSGVIMDQLPTQVANAYVIGDTTIDGVLYPGAVGVQLDVLGKYVGVTRTGASFSGTPITLNDSDFTQLIKMAAAVNVAGSSLADIQNILHTYFPNEIFVFDGADMQLSYLISSSVGNQNLIELFITEGLLPKPMGVELATVTYIPILSLFGLQDYSSPVPLWDAGTVYNAGQRVLDSVFTVIYTSLIGSNLGHDPTTSPDQWLPIVFPLNDYDTYPVYQPYTFLTYEDGIIL